MQENNKFLFPFYRVDAFSDKIFAGNPAGVCICNRPIDSKLMQAIATETNLSETAFVLFDGWEALKREEPLKLQWFTPRVEVKLCGHATLAAAYVLYHELDLEREEIVFETLSGQLTTRYEGDDIALCFPSHAVNEIEAPVRILESLGLKNYERIMYAPELRFLMVHVDEDSIVTALDPDFRCLEKAGDELEIELTGVIVTSGTNTEFDFISRFFAPWLGIDEDPATGASHTVLGPYWSTILGKSKMKAFQASKRGGMLGVRLLSESEVELRGHAVIFFRGTMCSCDVNSCTG